MRNMHRRTFLGIIIIALLGAFILSYLVFITFNQEETRQEKISVGVSHSESSFLLYLSKELGLFSENGLEVTLHKTDSGVEAMQALIEDRVDISTASEFVAVNFISKNPELQIISTIDFPRLIHLIVKKESMDNEKLNLSNLKIGIKHKSLAEFQIQKFNILNDIPHDNVDYIDINPDEMLAALKKGSLDGVVVWQPYVNKIREALGKQIQTVNIQADCLSYFLLITKENNLRERRAVPLLRSLKEAERFLYSSDSKKTNEEQVLKIFKDTYDYKETHARHALKDNDYKVSLPQTVLISMESERNWLIEKGVEGIKPGDYNYLDNIEEKYLKAVDPDSVSIY